jgi:hypothetical protein
VAVAVEVFAGVMVGVGVNVFVGMKVRVGVDVFVKVGVSAGPNNCPGSQVENNKLENRNKEVKLLYFAFIDTPHYYGRSQR